MQFLSWNGNTCEKYGVHTYVLISSTRCIEKKRKKLHIKIKKKTLCQRKNLEKSYNFFKSSFIIKK